jgi:MFS family permease
MAGSYADSIGRLKAIQLGCVWGILGGALLGGAQNFTWMAIARILSGMGCGHLNTIAPIWTLELADYNLRGRLRCHSVCFMCVWCGYVSIFCIR